MIGIKFWFHAWSVHHPNLLQLFSLSHSRLKFHVKSPIHIICVNDMQKIKNVFYNMWNRCNYWHVMSFGETRLGSNKISFLLPFNLRLFCCQNLHCGLSFWYFKKSQKMIFEENSLKMLCRKFGVNWTNKKCGRKLV